MALQSAFGASNRAHSCTGTLVIPLGQSSPIPSLEGCSTPFVQNVTPTSLPTSRTQNVPIRSSSSLGSHPRLAPASIQQPPGTTPGTQGGIHVPSSTQMQRENPTTEVQMEDVIDSTVQYFCDSATSSACHQNGSVRSFGEYNWSIYYHSFSPKVTMSILRPF